MEKAGIIVGATTAKKKRPATGMVKPRASKKAKKDKEDTENSAEQDDDAEVMDKNNDGQVASNEAEAGSEEA